MRLTSSYTHPAGFCTDSGEDPSAPLMLATDTNATARLIYIKLNGQCRCYYLSKPLK